MNVCHICKSEEVTFTCPKCLRHGCNDHYTDEKGIQCSKCLEKQLQQEERERHEATCYQCGKGSDVINIELCNNCHRWVCEDHMYDSKPTVYCSKECKVEAGRR